MWSQVSIFVTTTFREGFEKYSQYYLLKVDFYDRWWRDRKEVEKSSDFYLLLSSYIRHSNFYEILIDKFRKLNWGLMVNFASETVSYRYRIDTPLGCTCGYRWSRVLWERDSTKMQTFPFLLWSCKNQYPWYMQAFWPFPFPWKSGCLGQITHSKLLVFSISKSFKVTRHNS